MLKTEILNKLLLTEDLKITELRKDILNIFLAAHKPLTAYEVLSKLKKTRPKAEPPTVYRVIEYLMQKKLVHRIETGNKYVCCGQLENFQGEHHGFIFLCAKCSNATEFTDEDFSHFIQHFSKKNSLMVDNTLIEIKGICAGCLKKNKK